MREDIPFEDKVRQALEIGREHLRADNAHLTRIDEETNHWEAIVSTDPPDGQFPPGLEADLTTTYCRRVIDDNAQIALHDAPNEGWDDDPAYQEHELHCYLGTPLRVDGEQYGTVCFVSVEPRDTPHSSEEKLLAELITHMLERELEREHLEIQLVRQSNLSTVLNRVLRHNLRNKMAVARGYTQMMADKLPESSLGDMALENIDAVLNLSQKARELDEIIASNEHEQKTDITTLVNGVVMDIQSEYPSASFSVEATNNVSAMVLPGFRRAIVELVENAAKHGGDESTVDIRVESIPNAVEIRIEDDGLGLDAQEVRVLRTGTETPLEHGSGLGLWLAYWIVTRHDGTIDAEVTNDGTTLTVTVPRTPTTSTIHDADALDHARDEYKAAFDEAGDGMTITDDQARILDVNKEAARLYGENTQALLGRSLDEFLPDDFESEWDSIQSSTGTERGELQIHRGDEERVIEYVAKPDVVPGQHLIVSRDVTHRVAREQELARLKQAVENAGHAVFFTDADGVIEYVNPAFERITGYTRDEVIGKHRGF